MMKKFLSVALIFIMCFSMLFTLSACVGTSKGETAETSTIVNEHVESWVTDAASDEMKQYTKFFRFSDKWDVLYDYALVDPENAKNDPWGTGFSIFNQEKFDNMMDSLIQRFEEEKDSHPFAQKYLEELNKTNYFELSESDKLIFECYAKLIFSDNYIDKGFANMSREYFTVSNFKVNTIDNLVRAYTETDDEKISIDFYFSENGTKATRYHFFIWTDTKSLCDQCYTNMEISLPEEVQTELDVEAVKKIINDNISFFQFLAEYRALVYTQIREGEEAQKAKETTPEAYEQITQKSESSFTNKYGTNTTKCYVSGCSNYIANSGDTNCCEEHSNRCGECNCYIDGDAMFCMSCLETALK